MILGSHLSIAGGLEHAVEKAVEFGFSTLAMFVRNQRQWAAPPLTAEAVARFRAARKIAGIAPVIAHGSYLLNLAAPPGPVREHSLAAFADELDRCGRLGIEYYVFHPGSCVDEPSAGIARLTEALDEIVAACPHRRVKVLLEGTAGGGGRLGGTFEQLAEILQRLRPRGRFGACLDTCHLFVGGYDIRTPAGYAAVMRQFDQIVGLRRLHALHLNDSKSPFNSHWDRHEHIGAGLIGACGLANFINDPLLAEVPMILETPKGIRADGVDWDKVNFDAVRALVRRKR